jgi:hypothetical protein
MVAQALTVHCIMLYGISLFNDEGEAPLTGNTLGALADKVQWIAGTISIGQIVEIREVHSTSETRIDV